MTSFVNERDAPSVAEQSIVQTKSWRIVETVAGDRHLLVILDSGSLRVTSATTSFDAAPAVVTTSSGRKYALDGPPESRHSQLALLAANAQRVGLGDAVDVSDSIWMAVTRQ